MSSFTVSLLVEILVAGLLAVTIAYCITLNRRLTRLRSDEQSLKATIAELITATEIAGTYDAWIMGGHHACGKASTTGRWRCFGWNTTGQLGVGTTTNDGELVDLCP